MTNDNLRPFSFPAIRGKKVAAAFDGGRLTLKRQTQRQHASACVTFVPPTGVGGVLSYRCEYTASYAETPVLTDLGTARSLPEIQLLLSIKAISHTERQWMRNTSFRANLGDGNGRMLFGSYITGGFRFRIYRWMANSSWAYNQELTVEENESKA
jgi:hypothetical protein